MAFCAKCGTSLQEGMAFCVSCGAPVAAKPAGVASAAAPPPPAPVTPAPPPVTLASAPAAGESPAYSANASSTGMASNVAGMLTYLFGFITGIIFLVIEPYNKDRFVRFHAFQSIFLNVALIVFWIGFNIVWAILGHISFGILWFLMSIVAGIISLAIFLFWLFLMFKAYSNERFMVPFIGELAAKQASQ